MRKLTILTAVWLMLVAGTSKAVSFGDFLSKAQKTVQETVEKEAGELIDPDEPAQPQENDSPPAKVQASSNGAANSSSADQGSLSVADLPTGRRPATPGSLSLALLRFDASWLTGKTLEGATAAAVTCYQFYLKHNSWDAHYPSCLGIYEKQGKHTHDWHFEMVKLFEPEEVVDRNPTFAGKALAGKMREAMLAVAAHLPPQFISRGGWRGTYDFDTGELEIEIRLKKAQAYTVHNIPESIRYRDVYEPDHFSEMEWSGSKRGLILPRFNAVTAIAFDRNLGKGRLAMDAGQAEALFRGAKQNVIGGTALVDFTVDDAAGPALAATLEAVHLTTEPSSGSEGQAIELPAGTFPRLQPPKPVKAEKPKVAKATKPAAKPAPKPAPVDPLARAQSGQPYGPDIVGLKLGMTLTEADTLIGKRKPVADQVVAELRPFSSARLYVLDNGAEFIAIYALPIDGQERLAAIARTVYFDTAQSPSLIAVASSVEKKYGKPAYVYEDLSRFERKWLTNARGGRVAVSSGETRGCEGAVRAGPGNDSWQRGGRRVLWALPWNDGIQVSGVALRLGRKLDAERMDRCGPTVSASFETDSGNGTGDSLTTVVFDGAWIAAVERSLQAAEKVEGVKSLAL